MIRFYDAFRPYVAVLKDSFREAMVSRVLWIALAGILVLLAALAPFGLRTERSAMLRQLEIADPDEFLRNLHEGSTATNTPAAHLWQLLDDDQRSKIRTWRQPVAATGRPDRRGSSVPRQIVKFVNQLVTREDFYDEKSWAAIRLNRATRQLIEQSTTDPAQIPYRNLQLLAAAFSESIRLQDDPALTLTYATTEVFGPIDTMFSEFRRILDEGVILVLSVFLGFFGLFGSLLVSASIIPRTYEPGEISLLLSKPVSRSLLFITKFVGGCFFTMLCASVLVVGVWLLLGLRLHFWRIELLWCIPIYVFLFAVYFSVSAVAGVIWRNPVVSLILATLFWVLLFLIGTTRGLIDENVIKAKQIKEITVAGEEVFIVDGNYSIRRWNAERMEWQEVLVQHGQRLAGMERRLLYSESRLRPVFEKANERILALQPEISRFGGGASTIVSGSADGNWEREVEGVAPEPVLGLTIDNTGRIILPARRAIFQFLGQTEEQKKAQRYFGGMLSGLMKTSVKEAFPQRQAGKMPAWASNAVFAANPSNDAILIFSDGVLHRLNPQADGTWLAGVQRDLQTTSTVVMAAAGRFVLIAMEDHRVIVLNEETLETIAERRLPDESIPRVAEAAPDGSRLAVLCHDGQVIVFDGARATFSDWQPAESGRASAIAFDGQSRLIVSDGRRQLSFYRVEGNSLEKTLGVGGDWVYRLYDYVIMPLYRILPKPSELNQVVKYLVTGEEYVPVGPPEGGLFSVAPRRNLQRERIRIDLWTPVWNNCLFIAVMLLLACVYVSRRDF